MVRVFVFLCFLGFVSQSQAQDLFIPFETTTASSESPSFGHSPKLSAHFAGLLLGRDVEDDFYKSAGALTDIVPEINLKYNSWLSFNLVLEAFFSASNTRNFYTEEGKSINSVDLDEAAAVFNPLDNLEIRAGALRTVINPIYSIMSEESSFLGCTQKYEFRPELVPLTLTFFTDEAVPSSGTVSRGIIDDAPNAYFLTQTLQADAELPALKSTLQVASTHFEFGNLSSNVASDSILIGNNPQSFEGIKQNTRFIIGFGGFESAANLKTDWKNNLTTELKASLIQNTEAPSDGNWGTQARFATTFKFEKVNLIPSIGFFKMGGDVTPATYTIFPYRYHNRIGHTAQLRLELKKERVSFFGNYTRGDVLQPNPYMSTREVYLVGLEAKYDVL